MPILQTMYLIIVCANVVRFFNIKIYIQNTRWQQIT